MAAPYLTPAAVRAAVPQLEDVNRYPDDKLTALVAEFEVVAENYCGVAFTPRTAVETLAISANASSIALSWPRVRSVASIVVDGTTISASTYRFTEAGLVQSLSGFITALGYTTAQAVVTYDHGYDVPTSTTSPGAVLLRACAQYVHMTAVIDRSSVPRDIIATSADGMTTRYSTPDIAARRPTGWLEVDRMLNSLPNHRIPVFA